MLKKSIVRVKKHDRSSRLETDLEIEAIRSKKQQFLQQTYFGKNKNLIEDFFVIGLDKEADLPDIEQQYLHKSPDKIYCQSKVLYMHSNKQECQRRNVVKDFCFPNETSMQITMEKIKGQEDFGDVLYGQSDILRKNVFVFTMQADDMGDKDYQHENVYYCIC